MDLIAKLLPQLVNDLSAQARKTLYAVLVIIGALLVGDYNFGAHVGISFLASHVVSTTALAWYSFIVTPVLLVAHQNVSLPQWEQDLSDAVLPELTNAAAPAADIPNAETEAALAKVEPVVAAVAPVVESVVAEVAPAAVPAVEQAASTIAASTVLPVVAPQ